jgi:hypothetical protein
LQQGGGVGTLEVFLQEIIIEKTIMHIAKWKKKSSKV